MGVRPEDLFIADDGALSARVSHVEQLGGDTNIIATMNTQQITARLFGQHSVTEGQTLRFGFDPKNAYHFDEDGQRVA
jgi:multiple sugar transport system ATP-binding protein